MIRLTLGGILIPYLAFGWTLAGANVGGWQTHELAIYYSADNCPISELELTSIIDGAVATWNTVPTDGITLARAAAPVTSTPADFLASTASQTPVILCDTNFASDNRVDADFVPAATRLATSADGHIDYAGILLNAQNGSGAEISQLSESQLLVAITHEIGHVLGLGHSGSQHALMYYSIVDKSAPILTEDDMDGVSFLYPRSEFRSNPFGCASVHGKSSPASLGWIMVLLAVNLVMGRLLVYRSCIGRN